jgi:hypothetical protein
MNLTYTLTGADRAEVSEAVEQRLLDLEGRRDIAELHHGDAGLHFDSCAAILAASRLTGLEPHMVLDGGPVGCSLKPELGDDARVRVVEHFGRRLTCRGGSHRSPGDDPAFRFVSMVGTWQKGAFTMRGFRWGHEVMVPEFKQRRSPWQEHDWWMYLPNTYRPMEVAVPA